MNVIMLNVVALLGIETEHYLVKIFLSSLQHLQVLGLKLQERHLHNNLPSATPHSAL
jgi:hypothetical protein